MAKLISTLGGIAVLVAMALGSIAYFQPRSEATEKHLQMTEYSEIGKLENELKLTILEIDSILKMGPQNQRDTNQLEYLNAKRLNLETRLRELQGA